MYPQHEWKLERYWRDVSEGKVMEEEQIGILFWRVALEHKKLKKSPWKEHTGQLGEIPNSEIDISDGVLAWILLKWPQ